MALRRWLRVTGRGLPLGAVISDHQGDLHPVIRARPGGCSVLLLAVLHRRLRRWAKVFTWIEANIIALYFLNELLNYQSVASRLVSGNVVSLLDRTVAPGTDNFVIALLALSFVVLLARYLYKHKIFVRV